MSYRHIAELVRAFAICTIIASPSLGADSPEQLLTIARDGNRAAIRSINTLECRYERIPWGSTTLTQAKKYAFVNSGYFWQSGDTYRLIDPIDDGTTREYVVRGGRICVLRGGGPLPQPRLTIETRRPVDGVGGEMWLYMLFSHTGWLPPPRAGFYPFYEIAQHKHTVNAITRLQNGEIHLNMSHDGGRLEFWFDPKANYLIKKTSTVAPSSSTLRHEQEVISFSEPKPGAFVPTTIEHRVFAGGKLQSAVRTLLTEVKVNHRLADNALRIPGIAGMECIDLDRDVKYKVDADGNRVGPESKVTVVRHSPKTSDQLPEQYSHQSPSKPPTPLWVWILVGAAVILLIGIVLAIRRRRASALTT